LFFTFVVVLFLIFIEAAAAGESDVCACGEKTCVLIPPTKRGLPCYQGSPSDAVDCWNTDPFLTKQTTWKCSTCAEEGFAHFFRNDPIYKNMELWIEAGRDGDEVASSTTTKTKITTTTTATTDSQDMPLPYTREITTGVSGNDVMIMTTLLLRDKNVLSISKPTSSCDSSCSKAIAEFQSAYQLTGVAYGTLDSPTAQLLMKLHSADGVKDTGFTAKSMGKLYKIHVPVHNNRSIETTATLFDAENNVLHTFTARTHGHRETNYPDTWPDFGDNDYGLNQFTSSGNTITGVSEIDLNSPEPNPDLYGPWPVNRIVRGVEGNALLLLPNIRDGLLLHTGNWSTTEAAWDNSMTMPNSAGCIHAHPDDVKAIYEKLVKIGVKVNDNTFSGKNYPYAPQGVIVVELVD